jgi:hypothetical protein
LIGGTECGLDSISGALADYAAGQKASIYRDTDPVPVQPNGPGTADPSQYGFGNSDTLNASTSSSSSSNVLDGGRGNDFMTGGSGSDTLYISNGSTDTAQIIQYSDLVVGGGGNDWIMFTGSDTYWSGLPGSTTAKLGYALSNNGDFAGGQSISNIKLQNGDPIAIYAIGNAKSSGQQSKSDLGVETGSNAIVGNDFNNLLDGGGTNTGVDTLTGHLASAGYSDANLFVIGSEYQNRTQDALAGLNASGYIDNSSTHGRTWATDANYAYVTDFAQNDTVQLSGSVTDYVIGAAPSGFHLNNISGANPGEALSNNSTTFGIYRVFGTNGGGASEPNLVAVVHEVNGLNIGTLPSTYHTAGNNIVDGTNAPGHIGGTFGYDVNDPSRANFAGFGAMYDLSQTAFYTQGHMTFG